MRQTSSKDQPIFENLQLTEGEEYLLKPFFTNTDKPVFAVSMLPPEVIGALCSRASRAKGDLRTVFLNEFVKPFLEEESEYGVALQRFIDFLHINPPSIIFSNPKGREFYIKWLAQYGDDSIAQMAGTHLAFSNLSLLAIKHFETMRVGIAPIEKSTRYVDYSTKINGQYRYYTDTKLSELNLANEYKSVMDNLFDTYTDLTNKYLAFLQQKYPNEDLLHLKTKTFDTIRGILPISTLSQVAFYANGQALEYAISRSLKHQLAEIRWAGSAALDELLLTIPSFVRRLDMEISSEYQSYLSGNQNKALDILNDSNFDASVEKSNWGVNLIEYDTEGENKIIAGFIYPNAYKSYESILSNVTQLSVEHKIRIMDRIFSDRKARWYKVHRALEHAYLKFEVTANWGVWKDLQRHRMLTEQHELFNAFHGYDVPEGLAEAQLAKQFTDAVEKATDLFYKVHEYDPLLAQYCVTQTHYIRFIQYQNLRSFFWESELRTISQGHQDYRKIEHEKIKKVKEVYPLVSKYLMADMNDYSFARRGSGESIKQKEAELTDFLKDK